MKSNRITIIEESRYKLNLKRYRLNYPFGVRSKPTRKLLKKWSITKRFGK